MDATTSQSNDGTSEQDANVRYLGLARDAFSSSTSFFDSSIRREAEASIRQFQGQHPAGSKYSSDLYRNRSHLFRPKTRGAVRKAEATAAEALFSSLDLFTMKADDEDNVRQKAAAIFKKELLAERLNKPAGHKDGIPWFQICMAAYQDAQVVGVVISHQYWDYRPNKGIDRPCIELIPLENMRIDPGASWVDPINSSPYLIRMIPMYVKDVMARMRAPDPKTGAPKWFPLDQSAIRAATQSYSDTTRATRERGRQDSKDQQSAINSFAMVWVHQNIMEIDGVDHVWYTLGVHAMLSKPVPVSEVMGWDGTRPYVMGVSVIEAHKIYPPGPVGLTRDLQAEINEVANQRIDNVKFAMNKRWLAKRSGQVDIRSITRNVPGSVTLVNSLDDVEVVETSDVTGSAYQEHDRLAVEFDELAGNFSPSSVQANRRLNETVGGMKLLDAAGNQVSAYQLLTFVKTWGEPVLNQVSRLQSQYESRAELHRVAANKAGLWEMAASKGYDDAQIADMLTMLLGEDANLQIDLGMGTTNPQEKVNNFMLALRSLKEVLMDGVLERYGLDVKDVITEVFASLGYGGGKRFFDAGDDPALMAAKAVIQELQSQLAQKGDPPELVQAKVTELLAKARKTKADEMETIVRAIFASLQAGQVIAATPQTAPVGDAVLQAAGYQPPEGGGVDPNLPTAQGPISGLAQKSITDPRTGIEFNPGGAVAGDTSPTTPQLPATPGTGATGGIETTRSDSIQ
jgi:hypothetical protein